MHRSHIEKIEIIEEAICSLGELKLHARILHDDEDEYLASLIIAATEYAENYIGKYIRKRKITYLVEDNFLKSIILPCEIVCSVQSVRTIPEAGRELVHHEDYIYSNNKLTILNKMQATKLEIVFISGMDTVPVPLQKGIIHHAAILYEGISISPDIQQSISSLYRPYRKIRI